MNSRKQFVEQKGSTIELRSVSRDRDTGISYYLYIVRGETDTNRCKKVAHQYFDTNNSKLTACSYSGARYHVLEVESTDI